MLENKLNKSCLVAAHRGFKSHYPENTLLAFKEALHYSIDMIEFDIRITQDDKLVVIHDETVDRTTNGTGFVENLTFEQIRTLNANISFPSYGKQDIPSVDELFMLMSEYPEVLLNIEIKPSDRGRKIVDLLMEKVMLNELCNRSIFTSFDARIIHYLFDKYGVKIQGFPYDLLIHHEGKKEIYQKFYAIAYPINRLVKEEINQLKKKGLHVWCYCPNTLSEVEQVMSFKIGVMTCDNIIPALIYLDRL